MNLLRRLVLRACARPGARAAVLAAAALGLLPLPMRSLSAAGEAAPPPAATASANGAPAQAATPPAPAAPIAPAAPVPAAPAVAAKASADGAASSAAAVAAPAPSASGAGAASPAAAPAASAGPNGAKAANGANGAAAPAASVPRAVSGAGAGKGNAVPPPPPLVFTAAGLPQARLGVPYGPVALVRNMDPGTVFEVRGDLPGSGLDVDNDARLSGVPVRPGRYEFTLTLVGAAGAHAPLRQSFVVRVLNPRTAAAAAASAPKPVELPRELVDEVPAPALGPVGMSWKLTQEHLELLAESVGQEQAAASAAKAPPPPAPDAAAAPAGAAGPAGTEAVPSPEAAEVAQRTLARLQPLLGGVLDVEYPTRELLAAALDHAVRAACAALVQRVSDKSAKGLGTPACGIGPDLRALAGRAGADEPPVPPAAASSPTLSPRQAMAEWLPASQREQLLDLAQRIHPLTEAKRLRWQGGGCGCVPAEMQRKDNNFTYGLVPFWLPVGEPPMQVDFSTYTRIGYMGALLNADGSLSRAPQWNDPARDGLRVALRHGVGLDLVLYGRSLKGLLDQAPEQRALALQRVARELAQAVDTPLQGPGDRLLGTLLWPWPRPAHLYSGVTLFFAEVPKGKAAWALLAELGAAVGAQLQSLGRPMALQVAMPAEAVAALADVGAPELEPLRRLLLSGNAGEAAAASPSPAGSEAEGGRGNGRGTVTTRVLVLLPEPVTDSKKLLRTALDQGKEVQGDQRTAVLERLVPVMLYPTLPQPAAEAPAEGASAPPAPLPRPAPMPGDVAQQFGYDLAYHAWSFGGAALWPLPQGRYDADDPSDPQYLLRYTFRDSKPWWEQGLQARQELCRWVCPRRELVRGLFNLVLLGVVAATVLFLNRCSLRQRGWRFARWLLAGAVLCGALFLLLLSCDPDLYELSQGNALLGLLLALAGLWVLGLLLRRHVPLP